MARRTVARSWWMRSLCLSVLCWHGLAIGVACVSAQPNVWTLQTAERTALEHSPKIRSVTASRDTTLAYRSYASMPRAGNPFINLRAMIGKPDESAATYAGTLGIPFDVAGKRRAWRREAGSMIDEAEARLAATRNEVRAEARSAYVQVALANAARTVAEQTADTARELLSRVQARLDASDATALDVALSESQYAEAAANLSRAERALVLAQNAFRQALGLKFDQAVDVAPLPGPTLPSGLTLATAVQRARANRREIAIYKSSEQRWQHADGRLRAEAVRQATAQFETEAQANINTQYTVGAAVGFELPFVMRNQAARAVAHGEANAAVVERENSLNLIDREASSSFSALEAALAELAAIEERALPAAERTLAMVNTMLEAGAIDYFRVLTARSSAFALRSRRVEALREAWLCRIALDRAMGGWEDAP